MPKTLHSVGLAALATVLALFPLAARAQDYPNKPVRIVVGSGPGSTTDLLSRLVAAGMSKTLGQAIVVETKPGAGGQVAAEHVAKYVPPDGYTLLVVPNDIATYAAFMKSLTFDPLKDVPPITVMAEGSQLITTNSFVPFKTFNEMVAHARANPGKLNYAASSPRSLAAIVFESIKQKHNLNIVMIPYKNASAGWRPALLVNEVQLTVAGERTAIQDGDKVRVLGATGNRRLPAFPGVPTFIELGHPEIVGYSFGLHAPARVPKPIIDKLYTSVASTLNQPEVKESLVKFGLTIVATTPEESAKRLAEESRVVAEIVKKASIEAE